MLPNRIAPLRSALSSRPVPLSLSPSVSLSLIPSSKHLLPPTTTHRESPLFFFFFYVPLSQRGAVTCLLGMFTTWCSEGRPLSSTPTSFPPFHSHLLKRPLIPRHSIEYSLPPLLAPRGSTERFLSWVGSEVFISPIPTMFDCFDCSGFLEESRTSAPRTTSSFVSSSVCNRREASWGVLERRATTLLHSYPLHFHTLPTAHRAPHPFHFSPSLPLSASQA